MCCAEIASKLTLDMNKRNKNCCVEGKTAIVGGLRPCAGRMIMTTFVPPKEKPQALDYRPENEDTLLEFIVQHKATPVFVCPKYTEINREAKLVDNQGYHLISVVDGNKCKDSKKPWHVKWMGIAPGYKKLAYSWCCSQDIFSDYSLDPKKLCCGLSGAQSNYYAQGSQIMPDNPPCCRKTEYLFRSNTQSPLCEAYVWNNPSKTSPYRTCPPSSGLYDVTPNLDEFLHRAGPAYYAFPDTATTSDDLYSESRCKLGKKSKFHSFKYFYSFFSAADRLPRKSYKGTYLRARISDAFGLCCSQKNAFALSETQLFQSCCSTMTTKNDEFTEKRYISCTKSNRTARIGKYGFIVFPACRDGGCKEQGRTEEGGLEFDPKYRTKYTVQRPTGPYLYGSETFFVSKNVKATGPVPIEESDCR